MFVFFTAQFHSHFLCTFSFYFSRFSKFLMLHLKVSCPGGDNFLAIISPWKILLTFLESLKIVLINMVTTLMMSVKMTMLGLLKIKLVWNQGYDVIIFVHNVTNKILSSESNYIVDMVLWPKFGNSSISVT